MYKMYKMLTVQNVDHTFGWKSNELLTNCNHFNDFENLWQFFFQFTGGIGGVHRGAELTFDISCDLKELGRSQIAVVSAGVKSILDIGKTLEYLARQN